MVCTFTRTTDTHPLVSQREDGTYDVDSFVQDAVNLRVTPLMLDAFAAEYRESVRIKEAHILEMDGLRNSNRNLSAQV